MSTEQTDQPTAQATSQATETAIVILDAPIPRGNKHLAEITVRKPKAGALRGVNLTDLLQMDVAAATKVLPRITTPALTEADIRDMDPADLFQLCEQVSGFLLPKRIKDAAG